MFSLKSSLCLQALQYKDIEIDDLTESFLIAVARTKALTSALRSTK